ncbi:MAG: DUF1704 domain-containing protein [Gammaproteobacteria bacterium]|nr:DUF1704 domain-containing protein [Gammaproteobacteria bacterium]
MTNEHSIDPELIESLRTRVTRNELIRDKLPGGGRIHIERQQPFLCVYRYPGDRPDPGTDSLLLGQASYVLLPESPGEPGSIGQLISALAGPLIDAYGAAIVLELWCTSSRPAPSETTTTLPPGFRLVAPAHRAPAETLETLERALLVAHWPGGKPDIGVDYVAQVAPDGMQPLLTNAQLAGGNITELGLELAPTYRDPEGTTVYPEVLRQIRAQLGHALRQAFFTFSHTRATYRPAHYHELGTRAMTPVVHESDQALAAVCDSYELLLHVTPVNTPAAWQKFEASAYQRLPEFHYRPLRADPSELKAALYRIPIDDIEDPALHHLFATKRDETDRQITMLSDRETSRFLPESLQIYGRPDEDLIRLATALLERLPVSMQTSAEEPGLDAERFAASAREELGYYKQQDAEFEAEVEISDTVPGLMVSRGKLLVGYDASVDTARVDATLHHEVGTHLLTYHNGLVQPFQQLHAGLAGYEELQEGLAVFSEYLVDGLNTSRLRWLAARVLAAESVADGADFIETFRLLERQYDFDVHSAFIIAMRVHRAGGFTKDLIYLKGLGRLLQQLAAGVEITELLVGKISFDQIEVIRELRWRQVLEAPRLRPRYLENPSAQQRLLRASSGLTVMDMIGT